MRHVDTDHDDVRRARVRLVKALKNSGGELPPKQAISVIGLGSPTFSSAVLSEFLRAGNVHMHVEKADGAGRPKKRVVLRRKN